MKILNCPLNGPRNIAEFVYGGELRTNPDPVRCDARCWAEYVYFNHNTAGVVTEWWCHVPTSYWFLVERNTVTGQVLRTFDPSETFGKSSQTGREPDSGAGK